MVAESAQISHCCFSNAYYGADEEIHPRNERQKHRESFSKTTKRVSVKYVQDDAIWNYNKK